MTRCLDHETLVGMLYGEASSAERERAESHLGECARCRTELAELADVRLALTNWEAPALEPGVEVRVAARPMPGWRYVLFPALGGAAAAAVLLMAVNAVPLDVRYDATGFTFRTGAATRSVVAGDVQPPASVAPPVSPGALLARPTSLAGPVGGAAVQAESPQTAAEWRSAYEALEARLAGAEASLERVESALTRSGSGADADVLRRVRALIDESEVRQQQNLALRMAEMARDFDLQRQTDLVRIEQGFGRLESQHGAEAAQYRQVLDYIRRVSQEP